VLSAACAAGATKVAPSAAMSAAAMNDLIRMRCLPPAPAQAGDLYRITTTAGRQSNDRRCRSAC
jgi:hypothetical protein